MRSATHCCTRVCGSTGCVHVPCTSYWHLTSSLTGDSCNALQVCGPACHRVAPCRRLQLQPSPPHQSRRRGTCSTVIPVTRQLPASSGSSCLLDCPTLYTPSLHNVGRQGSSMAGHFLKQELSPGIQSVQYIFTVSLADLDRDGWPGNGSVQPLRVRRSLPPSSGCDTHSPTPPPMPLSHQT